MARKPDPVEATNRDLRFQLSDSSAARTLSAAQVEHFNQRGYVAPVDVFDDTEAKAIRGYIADLLAAVLNADDQRNSYSINTYHLVCQGLWDLATEPRLTALVRDIVGGEAVCWGSHLFAKMPGDGKEVPFHQDAIYWPLTPSNSVTIWLAIDDADRDNAAMQFVPGSHAEGPLEHVGVSLDGRVLDRQVADLDCWPERYLDELRAGQVSLHSDLLLHGSEANASDRRRAGLTLRYAAADVRLIDGYEDWRKTSVHVLGGDPAGFWYNRRRPDGEHPELMAAVFGGFDGQPLDAS